MASSVGGTSNIEVIEFTLSNPTVVDRSVPSNVREWCKNNGYDIVKRG
jgi:hypothetical protein